MNSQFPFSIVALILLAATSSSAAGQVKLLSYERVGSFSSEERCQEAIQLLSELSTPEVAASGSCERVLPQIYVARLTFAVQVPSNYTCGTILYWLNPRAAFNSRICQNDMLLLSDFNLVRNREVMISASCERFSDGRTELTSRIALTSEELCRVP
jgi:hypothetical protein